MLDGLCLLLLLDPRIPRFLNGGVSQYKKIQSELANNNFFVGGDG
jgi:hypothetical protein